MLCTSATGKEARSTIFDLATFYRNVVRAKENDANVVQLSIQALCGENSATKDVLRMFHDHTTGVEREKLKSGLLRGGTSKRKCICDKCWT